VQVIDSGPDDKVFVYYADHGAPGLLGMPSGPFLYADQLNEAIRFKAKISGFKVNRPPFCAFQSFKALDLL
jgi:legumain